MSSARTTSCLLAVVFLGASACAPSMRGSLSSELSTEELIAALHSNNQNHQEVARVSLDRRSDAVSLLVEQLRVTYQIKQPDTRQFIGQLSSSDGAERSQARYALLHMGERAVEPLLAALEASYQQQNYCSAVPLHEEAQEMPLPIDTHEPEQPHASVRASIDTGEYVSGDELQPVEKLPASPVNVSITTVSHSEETLQQISALISQLASSERGIRVSASQELEGIGVVAVPQLIAASTARDERVRVWSVTALGNIGALEARSALISATADASPTVRARAEVALGKLSNRNATKSETKMIQQDIRPRLITPSLPEPQVQTTLLEETPVEIDSSASTTSLISLLKSADRPTRVAATDALVARGAEAVPALITATTHSDDRVRVWSVTALGRIGSPAARGALNKSLSDSSATVRARAATALHRVN